MRLSYFIRLLSIMLISMAPFASAHAPYESNTKQLLEVPKDKASVGVVPYYVHDNQVFIFLARENINGIKESAPGTFCEFGGSVLLDGSNFVHNAIRELKEESMGQIFVTEEELLSKGKVLAKLGNKGRKIYYIFYPMTTLEYLQTKNFNELRASFKPQELPASYLEKDQFYWFKLQDIVEQKSQAQDIDGNPHNIKLRNFFVKDCVLHPELPALIASITTQD